MPRERRRAPVSVGARSPHRPPEPETATETRTSLVTCPRCVVTICRHSSPASWAAATRWQTSSGRSRVKRVLTLTGAGGCGKTRLALQVAGELVEQFSDGVWIVDLAPLSDPGLMAHTVAAILGVREGPSRSIGDALAEYLRPRHLLLVLDNCEHLIGVCAQLVEPLLRAAGRLQVLATSREALGIPGETVWRVPSMSAPAASVRVDRDTLLQYEAVCLFADRAATVDPTFAISDSNAPRVSEICRRLDGIPLAIELAAARLNVFFRSNRSMND